MSQGRKKRGRPQGSGAYKARLPMVRIDQHTKARIERFANQRNVSVSAACRELLVAGLSKMADDQHMEEP